MLRWASGVMQTGDRIIIARSSQGRALVSVYFTFAPCTEPFSVKPFLHSHISVFFGAQRGASILRAINHPAHDRHTRLTTSQAIFFRERRFTLLDYNYCAVANSVSWVAFDVDFHGWLILDLIFRSDMQRLEQWHVTNRWIEFIFLHVS